MQLHNICINRSGNRPQMNAIFAVLVTSPLRCKYLKLRIINFSLNLTDCKMNLIQKFLLQRSLLLVIPIIVMEKEKQKMIMKASYGPI
jgi:hypothetical protein